VKLAKFVLVALFGTILVFGLSCCEDVGDANQHFNAGMELFEQGQFEEAIEELSAGIRIVPDASATVYAARGFSYCKLGEYEKAIADFDEAIRLDPEYFTAYNRRGNLYIVLGDYDRAIEDLNESIRINPQNPEAYAFRALAYTYLYMDEKAQQDMDTAVDLGMNLSTLEDWIEDAKAQR
jgi:tetratricopeptide (TPR) repeat protein